LCSFSHRIATVRTHLLSYPFHRSGYLTRSRGALHRSITQFVKELFFYLLSLSLRTVTALRTRRKGGKHTTFSVILSSGFTRFLSGNL
jgi:hypothetical protein